MGVVLDTPLVHKSFSDVINKITPGAHIYDNPNQQGTKLPAWFIVHRDPVTITRDLDKRAWLTYGIDLYYMLELNMPRTFDSYSAVADALNTELKYLTIYGTQFKTHVIDRSWQLKLDCLCYSTTLKFRVSETEEPEAKMQVIEDLAVFLKNQPPEPPFYDITVEPSENGHVETDRDKAQKGRVITVTPYPDKDYMLQTIRVMCGARNIPVTDNSFIMPDGPVSIYSEFVEAPVAVLWRFFDDREPEPIMGYRYIHNLSKAKPIDHGDAHVLDVSPSVLSKGKPIDHGEVEVITPEMMPMMAARMIDHGVVSVLDVELNRIVEPTPPSQSLELVVFLNSSAKLGSLVDFSPNDYWYAVLRSNEDAQSLIDFGGEYETTSRGNNLITISTNLFYDIIDMYTGNGIDSIPSADLSNFWCSSSGTSLPVRLYIRSIDAYRNVQTWKVRITKNINTVSWIHASKLAQNLSYGGALSFYNENGGVIPYDSTKTYTLIGYYSSENPVSLARLKTSDNQYLSIVNVSGLGFLGIETTNTSETYTIQRVIYKVE